jgi:hypothetical protein
MVSLTGAPALGPRLPEPASVFGGQVQLPGGVVDSLVGVYRAEEYEIALAPDAQVAAPLGGTVAAGTRVVTGLKALPDGTLVFAVVRDVAGGVARLAAPLSSCTYRDATAAAGISYQYRVEAERRAQFSPLGYRDVRSLASNVMEGVAYDTRPPVPPVAAAAWDAAHSVVHITWAPPVDPTLEIVVQKRVPTALQWRPVQNWMPASTGSVDDAAVESGRTYIYRLRARNSFARTSSSEPELPPLAIP